MARDHKSGSKGVLRRFRDLDIDNQVDGKASVSTSFHSALNFDTLSPVWSQLGGLMWVYRVVYRDSMVSQYDFSLI